MPCWYFEKKEIKNTPSYQDGIDSSTEARYRREGARFINDAGTKLGLRYDTCATGVVYFHRFYMFHSFKEFPRHVTAACCLFLAGKVEETPKKCKDIIKISQQLLTPKQFSVFGSDPREEVMTLERILLQTIKFDLQTEHPYAYLLKYAKCFKADKEKAQKLVQMAWTFINDSLCTTLCLQWEPEIIAVALMYLGTRLNKFDITEWTGKVPGSKQKWWEYFIEDITVELMEDICHQVLDLYSPANQSTANSGDSPPPPPPVQPQNASRTPNSQSSDRKRSLQSTPSDPVTPGGQSGKSMKIETVTQSKKATPQKSSDKGRPPATARSASQSQPAQTSDPSQPQVSTQVSSATVSSGPPSSGQDVYGMNPPNPQAPATSYPPTASSQYPAATASTAEYSQYNPYVSSSQYQSSFLSQEGAQNLQTIMGTQPAFSQQPPAQPQYAGQYTQPPPPGPPATSATATSQYGISGAQQQYPPGYQPGQYPASAAIPGPAGQNVYGPAPAQPAVAPQQAPPAQPPYQGTSYGQYSQYPPGYQHAPPTHSQHTQQPGYDQQPSQSQYQGGGSYSGSHSGPRPRGKHGSSRHPQPRGSSALATVRITGR